MSTQAVAEVVSTESTTVRWKLGTRIAFRFCVLYFGLYCLSTQIITSLIVIPALNVPDLSALPPLRQIIAWTAAHFFRLDSSAPAFFSETGSGDRPCDWVLLFCVVLLALLGSLLWSAFDRRRTGYPALQKWFWIFFRYCLAGQMLIYGFAKIIPLQMPFPHLVRLLEPLGNLSPMGILWNSIGASPAYEVFAGSAELLGGLLLLIPATRTLGALVCLVDMVQVFMLNMTYDVPVKILSFQLILLSILLLAPEYRRILNFFFLRRTAEPPLRQPLLGSVRANRVAAALQIVFVLWLLAAQVYGDQEAWKQRGGGAPYPALYGIWDVQQFAMDGRSQPPLLTDASRWRRLIFDGLDRAAIQHTDDSMIFCTGSINANTVTLAPGGNRGANPHSPGSVPAPIASSWTARWAGIRSTLS